MTLDVSWIITSLKVVLLEEVVPANFLTLLVNEYNSPWLS